ncbi:MAG: tRNA (adenosine(37)-N6)-threonylcarbamoyltransferase complex ATPase subunit type 1 TsaE [Chloroflexi bacterium]|nr:tRNA (adenosine(37)-N6)-threonylcarbamoyltransferase complex ATPase subunit type 1 TsaE [Chloroflexota bacterium]
MPTSLEFLSSSPEETQAIAQRLGEACRGGEVFLLIGDLGAGKTCFTQGLAKGLGVEEYVHSPTFVLVAQYHGRLTVHHVDLYRIDSTPEAVDLGLDDYFNSTAVTVIEWADKAPLAMPPDRLRVEMTDLGGTKRRITVTAQGGRSQRLLQAVQPAPGKK